MDSDEKYVYQNGNIMHHSGDGQSATVVNIQQYLSQTGMNEYITEDEIHSLMNKHPITDGAEIGDWLIQTLKSHDPSHKLIIFLGEEPTPSPTISAPPVALAPPPPPPPPPPPGMEGMATNDKYKNLRNRVTLDKCTSSSQYMAKVCLPLNDFCDLHGGSDANCKGTGVCHMDGLKCVPDKGDEQKGKHTAKVLKGLRLTKEQEEQQGNIISLITRGVRLRKVKDTNEQSKNKEEEKLCPLMKALKMVSNRRDAIAGTEDTDTQGDNDNDWVDDGDTQNKHESPAPPPRYDPNYTEKQTKLSRLQAFKQEKLRKYRDGNIFS